MVLSNIKDRHFLICFKLKYVSVYRLEGSPAILELTQDMRRQVPVLRRQMAGKAGECCSTIR